MTALDIFVILLLGGAAMIGFVRGFAHEVLALFAWIIAIAALKLLHSPLQQAMVGSVGNEPGASALAFGLIFFPVYIAAKLFARAVGGKARKSILGPVDRVLGGGFGMLKGLLGATLFFLLVMNFIYGFFETFAIIDAVTKGGPAGATNILVYKVYQDGFINLDLGSSAAQSVLLMIFALAMTMFQFRYIEGKVAYGA